MDTNAGSGVPYQPPTPPRYDRDQHPTEFSRILALSDGVFAIALTLLVLDLAIPAASDDGLGSELWELRSNFIAFGVSVFLVGSAWWGHHRLFAMLQRANGPLIGLNIVYLAFVALIPFAQAALASYPGEPLAYVTFATVFAFINAVDTLVYRYAFPRDMLRPHVTTGAYRLEVRWGVISVALFLVSMPLAYVLGPFTIALWLAFMPVGYVVASLLAGEGMPTGRQGGDSPADPAEDAADTTRTEDAETASHEPRD